MAERSVHISLNAQAQKEIVLFAVFPFPGRRLPLVLALTCNFDLLSSSLL